MADKRPLNLVQLVVDYFNTGTLSTISLSVWQLIDKITVFEKQWPIYQKLGTSPSAIRILSRLEGVSDNAQWWNFT
jgi:hypothetical protein